MNYLHKISVIQSYIHHVKNVQVNINPPRNIGEIKKMDAMYLVASNYLRM